MANIKYLTFELKTDQSPGGQAGFCSARTRDHFSLSVLYSYTESCVSKYARPALNIVRQPISMFIQTSALQYQNVYKKYFCG